MRKDNQLDLEFWEEIPLFEGVYQISSHGRLKSFKRIGGGYILSNVNIKGGYLSIVLSHREEIRYTRIHRLVAEAFIPNPEGKSQVNHKDTNKQNNSADNLEWVTPKENVQDAIMNGVDFFSGMNNYNKYIRPKRIQQSTLEGEFIEEYLNGTEASYQTGVCHRNILQVASRDEYKPGLTRKQAGGFIWKFREGEND